MGLERGIVDCVARSTGCPRCDEELEGGAIVEDREVGVTIGGDPDWGVHVGLEVVGGVDGRERWREEGWDKEQGIVAGWRAAVFVYAV